MSHEWSCSKTDFTNVASCLNQSTNHKTDSIAYACSCIAIFREEAVHFFCIDSVWHFAKPLILIPSISWRSHRDPRVCLTSVDCSLCFCLSCDEWYDFSWYGARLLIHKYEQTCVRPHFRVIPFFVADVNAPSLTLRELVSPARLLLRN